MKASPLRVVLVVVALTPLLSWAEAAAPSPLTLALQQAAAGIKSGGFVFAESVKGEVRYATAGQPGARASVAPERMIFEIGSISKVFTSLLLAQTVLEGKASLSDPLSKYLPAALALDPKVAGITLEQLATHTSGLPRLPDNMDSTNALDPYANFDTGHLEAFLRNDHPSLTPPQPFAYSNLGAGLLGHVLELIHGKSYATLLAERITGPLGLPDTVITLSAEQQTRFATPHSGSQSVPPWNLGALTGAGAIRSTAADLVKFGQALLAPDSPVHAAWELMRSPRASAGGGQKIGLAIFSDPVRRAYFHDGGTGGFRAYLELVPASDRVVVVLLNNDSLDIGPFLAATLGPKPALATSDTRVEVPIDPAKLAEYFGVYVISGPQRFTVIKDESGRLRIRLTGQIFGPVIHLGHDRFLNKKVAAEFQFNRNATGEINSLVLFQNGREIPSHRTSEPPPTVIFLSGDKLQDYTGTYQLTPAVVFEVMPRAGHLFAKLTGQGAYPVFCDRPDHFVYDIVEAALSFERNDTGAVTALVLHQNGLDQRAARVADAKP